MIGAFFRELVNYAELRLRGRFMDRVSIEVPVWFARLWDFVGTVPWPLALAVGATLIALLAFTVQLTRYGPAIKRLNKLEVLSQLYHLGETQKEMTRAFGDATASASATRQMMLELNKAMETFGDAVTDIQTKMAESNADKIVQAQLEAEEQALPPGTYFKRPAAAATPPQSQEQLMESMKRSWTKFLDAFRARLEDANVPVQLNRIGKMTYMLTDGRRRYPLPVETADLITALHSQYKRFIALQRISSQEHDNFVQLVKTAILEVQKKTPRPDTSTARNGAGEHDPQLPLM